MATILFWSSALLIVYAYVGFPLLVGIVGSMLRRPVKKEPITPSVSLIVAAYNEEAVIAERIENALNQDYPAHKLEILIASDGSTDQTEAIVSQYGSRIRLLRLPRRGKLSALAEALGVARGELVVFSDANTMFETQAIRKMVSNFADPKVGGVAGNKIYRVPSNCDSSGEGERMYWSYDKWLKGLETRAGSTVSADGAIYAIRKSLFQLPKGVQSVTDDFAISTGVVLQGFRLVFDPEAKAFESTIAHSRSEFNRKVRLMTRGLQGLLLRRNLFNPFRYGFYSVQIFSHKLLRRLVGFLLVIMFLASAVAAIRSHFFMLLFIGQSLFYLTALAGALLRQTRLGRSKPFLIPFFFCLANLAAMVAVLNLLRGRRFERWEPQRHSR